MTFLVGPYEVLIDDEDYEKIRDFYWGFYRQDDRIIIRDGSRKSRLLHRLIMNVSDPKRVIDHINGNTLDNRKENLRVCSSAENVKNCRLSKKNTSGFKGASFHKPTNRWVAYISINGKNKNLGYFSTPEQAHIAYREAAKKYYGEFARFE